MNSKQDQNNIKQQQEMAQLQFLMMMNEAIKDVTSQEAINNQNKIFEGNINLHHLSSVKNYLEMIELGVMVVMTNNKEVSDSEIKEAEKSVIKFADNIKTIINAYEKNNKSFQKISSLNRFILKNIENLTAKDKQNGNIDWEFTSQSIKNILSETSILNKQLEVIGRDFVKNKVVLEFRHSLSEEEKNEIKKMLEETKSYSEKESKNEMLHGFENHQSEEKKKKDKKDKTEIDFNF